MQSIKQHNTDSVHAINLFLLWLSDDDGIFDVHHVIELVENELMRDVTRKERELMQELARRNRERVDLEQRLAESERDLDEALRDLRHIRHTTTQHKTG